MRSTYLAVIVCTGLFASCAHSEGAVGNTELTLTIGDGFGAQPGEAAFDADRVDYRIAREGSDPGSFPIFLPGSDGSDHVYDDAIDISGSLEIVDAQDPPVWVTIMDLPAGDCIASLSVYRNHSIVCQGSRAFAVLSVATQITIVPAPCASDCMVE